MVEEAQRTWLRGATWRKPRKLEEKLDGDFLSHRLLKIAGVDQVGKRTDL